MFEKDRLSVLDWFLYFLLMAIPVVNVIFFLIILLKSGTNPTLRNYMICLIICALFFIAAVVLLWAALVAFLQGFLDSLPVETFIPFLLKYKLF